MTGFGCRVEKLGRKPQSRENWVSSVSPSVFCRQLGSLMATEFFLTKFLFLASIHSSMPQSSISFSHRARVARVDIEWRFICRRRIMFRFVQVTKMRRPYSEAGVQKWFHSSISISGVSHYSTSSHSSWVFMVLIRRQCL